MGEGWSSGSESRKRFWLPLHTCGKALAGAGAFRHAAGAKLPQYLVQPRSHVSLQHGHACVHGRPNSSGLGSCARRPSHEQSAARKAFCDFTSRGSRGSRGQHCGSSVSQIVPVLLGTNEAALEVAAESSGLADGYAVKAIRPPTVPAGTARLRLSLTSAMTALRNPPFDPLDR